MRPQLRAFDESVSTAVGRLPDSLQRPAHYVGLIFVPWTWLGLLALYALLQIGNEQFVPALVAAALTPLATIVKHLFRRKRPPTIYAGTMKIKSYSFPSSHAYAAALGGGFFAVASMAAGLPLLAVLLVVLAFTIGASRILLGAHYPSDVCGGWLTAIVVLSIITII